MKLLALALSLLAFSAQASLTPYVPYTGEYYTASQMTAIKTANYTVAPDDVVVLYDISAGDIDLQLPDPSAGRRVIKFINTNPSGAWGTSIHIKRYGSEKISNVAATYDFGGAFLSISLVSDLTDWHIETLIMPAF